MEWLNNIWLWFVENKNQIITVIMSGQALTFVGALVMIIRQFKSIKSNTNISHRLNDTLVNTNTMSKSLTTVDERIISLVEENRIIKQELAEVKDNTATSLATIVDKVNAMIEVQSVVYSTIKDEDMRETVNKLLNNARYSEINLKDQFQKQLDELRDSVATKLNDVTNTVDETLNKMTSTVTPSKETKTKITRY